MPDTLIVRLDPALYIKNPSADLNSISLKENDFNVNTHTLLLPYSMGVFQSERKVPFHTKTYYQTLLSLSDRRFAQDVDFLFTAYNRCLLEDVYSNIRILVRRGNNSIITASKLLNEGDFKTLKKAGTADKLL